MPRCASPCVSFLVADAAYVKASRSGRLEPAKRGAILTIIALPDALRSAADAARSRFPLSSCRCCIACAVDEFRAPDGRPTMALPHAWPRGAVMLEGARGPGRRLREDAR